jgi:hypothetical protein
MAKGSSKETYDSAKELAKVLGKNTSAVQAYLQVQEKVRDIQKEMVDLVKEEAFENNSVLKANTQALDALKRKQENQKKINALTEKYTQKWREFKEIASDPKIAKGLFLIAAGAKAKEIGESFHEMQHSAGLAYTQTLGMAGTLTKSVASGWMLGVGFKASAKAAGALANELGDVGKISSEAVVQVASMAKSYGISEQEGAKLFKQMKAISGASDKIVASAMRTTIELARANGVAPGKVMQDIASNTEFFAGFAKKGGQNIAETAVQAAKLGLSLGDVSSMVNSILDVESSIEKEMEASVLLNRQISFDKARQLAMSGDTLGATKAILEQVGGVAEFENMSIMQRKALADAAGIELSVMQQMVSSRESQIEMGLVQESQQEKALKMASGITSFAKDNAGFLASSVNFLASAKHIKMGTWLKEKAHWAAERIHSLFMGKTGKGVGGGSKSSPMNSAKGATSFSKGLNPTSMIKGAAAMVIMGAALWVAAKGFQELAKVDWASLFPGAVIALVALTAAMVGLSFIAPMVLTGALVFGAMSLALLLFGTALNVVAGALPMMVNPLTQLATIGGTALMGIGLGFGAMGLGLMSMATGLALITPMLPTLLAVGGLAAVGMNLLGGDSSGSSGGGDNIIGEKLDILIELISKGGTINMDGKKVGDVIALAQGPMGA